jgi:hypothetical protein
VVSDGRHDVHIEVARRALWEDGRRIDHGGPGGFVGMKEEPGVTHKVEVASVVVAFDFGCGHRAKVIRQCRRLEGVVTHPRESFELGWSALEGAQQQATRVRSPRAAYLHVKAPVSGFLTLKRRIPYYIR